jgi:hypothetical protein
MTEQELRFECLKLAIQTGSRSPTITTMASEFAEFVKGGAHEIDAPPSNPTCRKAPTSLRRGRR